MTSIIFLIIDNVLYALLAVYLDHVIPGEYGPRFGWLFCLKGDYWFSSKRRSNTLSDTAADGPSALDIEEVSVDTQQLEVIRFQNIHKVFNEKKKNEFVAVDNISMSIYLGQITAILGHNGAGKTTLMNMLAGTLPVTSGTVKIFGYDISNSSDVWTIRSMLGVCLQQDILNDDLSAVDHLSFFAEMKGVEKSDIHAKTIKLLDSVGLANDADKPSVQLSGGQKRKLCVCIALIGDPKIVILGKICV